METAPEQRTTTLDAAQPRWRGTLRTGLVALPYVVITALVFALVAFHTHHYEKLSPIDEQAHVDYLYKVRDGHLPRLNELMGQDALDTEACTGFYSGYTPPPCLPDGERYDPGLFQFGGVSAAVQHPPLYYAGTVLLAEPINLLPGVDDYLSAARIATGAWLAAALCLMWWLLLSLGASRIVTAAILTIFACTSQVLLASSSINPDATALLAGALMLCCALRWRRPRIFLPLAALVVMLKATNVLVVLAAALLLLILEWDSPAVLERRTWLRRLVARFRYPTLISFVGGMAGLAWTIIVNLRALPPLADQAQIGGQPATFFSVVLQFFPPTANAAYEPWFVPSLPYLLTISLTAYLLITSAAGAALMLPFRDLAARIGWVAFAGMVLGPPIVMLLIRAGADVLYAPPTRYGMSLLPFIAAPLMLTARSIPARTLLGAFGIATAIITVYAMSKGVPPPVPVPPA